MIIPNLQVQLSAKLEQVKKFFSDLWLLMRVLMAKQPIHTVFTCINSKNRASSRLLVKNSVSLKKQCIFKAFGQKPCISSVLGSNSKPCISKVRTPQGRVSRGLAVIYYIVHFILRSLVHRTQSVLYNIGGLVSSVRVLQYFNLLDSFACMDIKSNVLSKKFT